VASAPQPVPKKPKLQVPPEPKTGSRPKIRKFGSFQDEKNVPVWILFNSGCNNPVMFKHWADSHGVRFVTPREPTINKNRYGERVEEEVGWQYIFPVTLQYESPYTKVTFEIGPMEDSSYIQLPYW
jgi:hypothetical protein